MTDEKRSAVKPAAAWFDQASHSATEAFARVLATSTTAMFPSMISRDLDWGPFEEELARLVLHLRERHAAKHAATIEAMYSADPIVIAKGGPYR